VRRRSDRRRGADQCTSCPANHHKYDSESDECQGCRNEEFGTHCEYYRVGGPSQYRRRRAGCASGHEQQEEHYWLANSCCETGNGCCGSAACCTTSSSWTASAPTCGYSRCTMGRRLSDGSGGLLEDNETGFAALEVKALKTEDGFRSGPTRPLVEDNGSGAELGAEAPETEEGLRTRPKWPLVEDAGLEQAKSSAPVRQLFWSRRRRRRRAPPPWYCRADGECMAINTDGVTCFIPERR